MIRAYVEGGSLEGLAEEAYQDLEPRMMKAADAGAEILLGKVQDLLSREGEPVSGGPPAKRTGELREAFRRLPAKKSGRTIRAKVGVLTDTSHLPSEVVRRFSGLIKRNQQEIARKAAALEHGGTDRKGRYHPPHPYMRPAEQTAETPVRAAIDRILAEGD